MRKNRLYVLGDSFAANLFKEPWLKEGTEIYEYKKYFESQHNTDLLWWTDYIEKWSNYEVFNFGIGGCSMEDILLQLSNVGEYQEGDRMVIHLTTPLRFKYYMDHYYATINPDFMEHSKVPPKKVEFLLDIANSRLQNWYGDDGNTKRKFIDYLYRLHNKFKPIIFSVFLENVQTMKNEEYFTNLNELLRAECTINVESGSKFSDGHWGYVGNLRVALLILSYLLYGDEFSTEEKIKISNYFPKNKSHNLENLSIYKDYISMFYKNYNLI